MSTIKLPGGRLMPAVGFGTLKLNNASAAVEEAAAVGYRLFDCAQMYRNQAEVGAGLINAYQKLSLKRSDIFVTSKIWNTNHSFKRASAAVDSILQEMRLDYLDLCLIHNPVGWKEGDDLFPQNPNGKVVFSNVDYMETWRALEQLKRDGKVLNIGVSSFNTDQMKRIIAESSTKISNLQVECHPYFQQRPLLEFCAEHDISVTAYSSLGNPGFNSKVRGLPNLLEDTVLCRIGQKYEKTPAQVCLRWALQRGVAVIPKSNDTARMAENLAIADGRFCLDSDDMAAIGALDRGLRYSTKPDSVGHPLYPF